MWEFLVHYTIHMRSSLKTQRETTFSESDVILDQEELQLIHPESCFCSIFVFVADGYDNITFIYLGM